MFSSFRSFFSFFHSFFLSFFLSFLDLKTGGRWFYPRHGQYSFRGLMIVIVTGFIHLPPLSNDGYVRNGVTGQKNSRKAWIGAPAGVITKVMFETAERKKIYKFEYITLFNNLNNDKSISTSNQKKAFAEDK